MKEKGKGRFELTETHRKILAAAAVVIYILLFAFIGYYVGRPAMEFVSEPEKFRLWVQSHGIWGEIIFVAMTVLQVFVALIPGEPFEIVAGYAFGAVEGTALSLAGCAIGGVLVFLFVRRFGMKAVEVFFSKEKIHSLRFLRKTKRRDEIFFVLFMLPGTPKDLLCYFAGLTDMKLSTWLVICTLGRIPSVVTSTIGGEALNDQNYAAAIIAFTAAALLAGGGYLIYKIICDRRGA